MELKVKDDNRSIVLDTFYSFHPYNKTMKVVLFYLYVVDEETDSEDGLYSQVGLLNARARA